MKIALDVGHAASSGATGNALREHDVAASAAAMLVRMLRPHSVEGWVVDFPALSNRADLAATIAHVNECGYDAVVSLHCDCAASRAAHGAHVIYKTSRGSMLAVCIAQPLCALMPGRVDAVVQRHDLAILNQTRPPAVLVEMGFLSHEVDARMLRDNLPAIAHAIAAGIVAWCGKNKAP